MEGRSYGKAELVRALGELGLRAGDVVLVHSSLASLGHVEGGAPAVIEALLEVLTPTGTLLMPAFNWSQPYDRSKPSVVGLITEVFRTWPGVCHSFHPTHPVSALGPKAKELTEGHLQSPTACGRETPFGKLIEIGGKILLLGVDHDRNTTLHTLEDYAEAAYLSERTVTYLDDAGQVQAVKLTHFPGPHRDFLSVGPLLRASGSQVSGKVGNAVATLVDARRMHDVLLEAFARDPALVLCSNPNCADCVAQRTKLRMARLAREDFRLSALASSVSTYPEEIAHELKRAGLSDVVVDRLYGRPVWMVPENRLARAAQAFREEGVAVGAIYGTPDAEGFAHQLHPATILGADTVVVPLPPDPAAVLSIAQSKGLQVLFGNTHLPSAVVSELLAPFKGEPLLAFNPAHFVLAGEKPFLGIVNHGRLRREIGMLLLSDATFDGRFTLAGMGNGEVKEILSILRSRSFAGRVVIGTGPGGPPFRELVESFWSLLEGQ